MKDISFKCPKCDGSLVVEPAGCGLVVDCPHCSQQITIPTTIVGESHAPVSWKSCWWPLLRFKFTSKQVRFLKTLCESGKSVDHLALVYLIQQRDYGGYVVSELRYCEKPFTKPKELTVALRKYLEYMMGEILPGLQYDTEDQRLLNNSTFKRSRIEATCHLLNKLDQPGIIPVLERLVKSDNTAAWVFACEMLGRISTPPALDALAAALSDRDLKWEGRRTSDIANILRIRGDARCVATFIELTLHGLKWERKDIVDKLTRLLEQEISWFTDEHLMLVSNFPDSDNVLIKHDGWDGADRTADLQRYESTSLLTISYIKPKQLANAELSRRRTSRL